MQATTQAQHIEQRDDGWVRIRTDGVELRVLMMSPDIVRIRAGFDGDFTEESYTLVTTAWADRLDDVLGPERTRIEPAPARLEDHGDAMHLVGERLTVEIRRHPLALRVVDADGTLLHADVTWIGYREDRNGRRIHTSLIEEGDAFVGFGETTGPLDKHRERLLLSPRDAMGYDPERTDPLYKHIPFYVKVNRSTQRATGFFHHTTFDVEFDMGRSHSNYFPHHAQVRADGGDIDLFIIAGPTVRDVITRYTWLTGRPAMLPRQALGYLASSMYYAELPEGSDEAITRFIDIAREQGIPVDGFQLSSGYTTQETADGPRRCVFTWNDRRFPDPAGFFAQMAQRNITVSPNVKPGILLTHPRLDEFTARDAFIAASSDAPQGPDRPAVGAWWGGPGRFIDFTAPQARAAWQEWLTDAVLDQGTSSVWNDNCEYDGLLDLDSRCDFDGGADAVGAGASAARVRNVMANLMCAVTDQAIRTAHPHARPFIVSRAGHAGIQRYAQTWAGDNATSWESLRANIATILGMGLSGVPNHGCDIGGFHGPRPGPELLLRWVQHGIFQPRFSIHSVNSDNTVTEPWMHPSVAPLVRDAIALRYRLVPYLYSLMARAHRTGLPILEPLISAFPQDVDGYDTTDVFMLGDALLVATVLEEGARERTIRFPAGGVFVGFEDGAVHEGGSTVSVPVDLSSIPLFLRAGAILPLAQEQPMSLARDDISALRILCVPASDGEFVLYEDDGTTRAYEHGDYRETTIAMRTAPDGAVHLDLNRTGPYRSAVRSLQFEVSHPRRAPLAVLIGEEPCPHLPYRPDFDQSRLGWHVDAERGTVLVRTPDEGEDLHVRIDFGVFDMIGM